MIVIDINLLVYAYDTASPFHKKAAAWVEQCFTGSESIGLSWHVVAGFFRISTDSRLPGERFQMAAATRIVNGWLEQPQVQILAPGRKHWEWLQKALEDGQVRGPLVSDAELAALTMEYGGVLYTTDRDFARFPGLRWKNPLLPNN